MPVIGGPVIRIKGKQPPADVNGIIWLIIADPFKAVII